MMAAEIEHPMEILMKILLFPLAGAVLMVGCVPPAITPEEIAECGPKPTDAEVQKAVDLYVQTVEKDPDAAKIRNVVLQTPARVANGWEGGGGYTYGWLITVEINGKNSYGAYEGFQSVNIQRKPNGDIRWGF